MLASVNSSAAVPDGVWRRLTEGGLQEGERESEPRRLWSVVIRQIDHTTHASISRGCIGARELPCLTRQPRTQPELDTRQLWDKGALSKALM